MTNIYIGNLSYRSSEGELRELFEKFGEVQSASIVKDRDTNRSKGFGFVEMPNAEDAKKAIEALNDKEIGGRPLRVNEARPREERPQRSGGGFGGGRRDGGFSRGGRSGGFGGEGRGGDREQDFGSPNRW